MKIAGNLTIKDWEDLEKNLVLEKDEKWESAFHFFEERIITRYIKPINAILNLNNNLGEGFAVVNIQCSLIETIESFINGCIHEYDIESKKLKWKKNGKIIFHSNKEIFKSFFEKRKPFIDFNQKINGAFFYEDVRCSLLHETQTKNNWKICKDKEKTGLAYIENGGEKIIHRENFQRDLNIAIKDYKNSIINNQKFCGTEAIELRENFKSKFNHICKKS